jgi:D-alanine-D-alanine ligase
MKHGVCTSPCGVVNTPRRAAPSVAIREKENTVVVRRPSSEVLGYSDTVKRLRVGVLYGGRSGEHEVSLASAASVFANLDRKRYEPVPIRIEKDGRWALADKPPTTMVAGDVIEQARLEAARPLREGREVHFVAHPSDETILSIARPRQKEADVPTAIVTGLSLDVIFPMLHGPYGEDGTIQGLLELANVPYVGSGVLASAVGMDKAVMKVVFAARGLPVCPYRVVLRHAWEKSADGIAAELEAALRFPMFVKPANLGSSVGISKAKDAPSLRDAMDLAGSFDRKIVIEAAVPDAREIECGVLGNDDAIASVPGEVIPSREFYDYDSKYIDDSSRVVIPADLPEHTAALVRQLAVDAFAAVDAAGMARVDFLLSSSTGTLYVNEINTIPGFTTISMYAKLWAASGVDYPALLDRLIALAQERHADKQQLRTSVT